MLYPSTKQQLTPRKRAVGIRPRTFNYYCMLFVLSSLVCILNIRLIRLVTQPPIGHSHLTGICRSQPLSHTLWVFILLRGSW